MPENIALPIQLNKKEIGRLNTFSFNNKNRTQMANSESEFIDNCITAIAILCMVGGYFTITVIIPMLIFSNHKNMTLPEQNYTQKILLS